VLFVPLAERQNDWLVLQSSAERLHERPKLVRNMGPRVDDTHMRARHGTHRRNQLGLRAKYSHKKSSRCSRTFQHLLFDHELVFRVGMRARSDNGTARIHGTGRRWESWLAVSPPAKSL
jgi:hypothetical protein